MIRVLIVDDKLENLYLLRVLLEGNGYEVQEANNGSEALEKARKERPDLIISDLLMPVMDGYTLLREWRRDERLQKIPFIVYTATYTDPKDERLALDLGADAFLIKPLEPIPFLARIEEVLSKTARENEYAGDASKDKEDVLLKQYSEVLVNKLEAKVFELERVNRELQDEITRRRQTEQELRQAQKDWEDVFQSIGQPTLILDPEHGIVAANRQAMELTGKSLDALLHCKCYDVFHPDGEPPQHCPMEALLASGRAEKVEMEVEALGRSYIVSCSPLTDDQGNITRVIHIASDITEHRKTEELLRKSEARLSGISESALDAIVMVNDTGEIAYWNSSAARIFGYTADEATGKSVHELLAPAEYREVAAAALREFAQTGWGAAIGRTVELQAIRKDGEIFPIELSLSSFQIDGSWHAVGCARDITDRKKDEEALSRSERHYRMIFEHSPIGIMHFDQGGIVNDVNEAFVEIMGAPREKIVGFDMQAKLTDVKLLRAVQDSVSGKLGHYEGTYHSVVGQKTTELRAMLRPILADDGTFLGGIGIFEDITQRSQAERNLRESEAKFKAVFDNEHVVMLIVDPQTGAIVDASPAACKLYGYSRDDFKQRTIFDLNVLSRDAIIEKMQEASGKRARYFDFRHRCSGGAIRDVEVSSGPIFVAGRELLLSVILDVTERKQAEKQLRETTQQLQEAQRIAHIGNWELDMSSHTLSCSDETYRILEVDPGSFEASYEAFLSFVHPEDREVVDKAFMNSVENKIPYNIFYRLKFDDGRVKYVHERCVHTYGENGTVVSSLGTAQDITSARIAEEALRESEELHRLVLSNISDAVFLTDAAGDFTFVCPNVETIFGLSVEQVFALATIDRVLGGDLFSPDELDAQDELRNIERTVTDLSGIDHNLLVSVKRVSIGAGELLYVCRDVTEKKQAEDALKDSELRYRLVVENSSDVIWTMAPYTGRLTFISPSAERTFGFSAQEFMEMTMEDWLPPEHIFSVQQQLADGLAGKIDSVLITIPMKHKNGHRIWVELNARLSKVGPGDEIQVVGISRDITERRNAEMKLEESEENLRSFFDGIPESLLLLKPDGTIVTANQCFANRLNKPLASVIGKSFFDLVPPEYAERHRFYIAEASRTLKPQDWVDERLGRVMHTIIYPVVNLEGTVERLALYASDITEARLLEESLRLSEERYRTILDLSPTGIFVNVNERIVYANQNFADMLGYPSPSELIGQNVLSHLAPEYHQVIRKRIDEMMKTGRPVPQLQEQMVRSDGTRVHVEVHAAPIDYEGSRGFIVIANDITERERMQTALEESETRFRTTFMTSPDAVTLSRLSGTNQGAYVDVNEGFCDLTGYTREEVIGKSTLDLDLWTDPADRERFLAGLVEYGEAKDLATRFRLKDGSSKFGLFSARIINLGGVPHVLAVTRDVDDWKKAEMALQISEERFRQVADVADEWIWEVDETGLYRYCSAAVERIIGYKPDEVVNHKFFWEFLESPDGGEAGNTPLEVFKAAKSFKGYVSPHVRKDGQVVLVETSATSTFDADGAFTGYRGTSMDVTERIRAAESRELLAAVVEHASESIVVTDPEGNIEYVNPSFETTTGYSNDEVLGLNPRILKSGKQDERFYRDLWTTITEGRVWKGHFINKKKDGTLFEEDSTISPLRREDGSVRSYVAVKRDVTKETEMQKQLVQSQKMEAIGTLAGGIAHDFNNILFAMVGFTELAMDEQPEDSPTRRYLGRVLDAAKRAADMVTQILTFSRQHEPERKLLDLRPVIKEGLKFLGATIPPTIEIRQNIASLLGKVEADPTQIHQILMNLCTNAAHAMKDTKGVLTVDLEDVTLDEEFSARHLSLAPGKYVRLAVSDTGHGIRPEDIDRIFEPYFTTKGVGEGTGLGLAVIHGIVQQHGGTISVYSQPGIGTTFNVFLPVKEDLETAERVCVAAPCEIGHERVLVVDDEEILLEMTRAMLESLGYEVVCKKSPLDALELFRADPEWFDLVLTDFLMPGLTGEELAREIIAVRPGMPIILCTGFVHKFTDEEAEKLGIRAVIKKPILRNEVAKAIRTVLEKKE